MATWQKIITDADDASYSNSSIDAGDLPSHSGDLITSGTVAVGYTAAKCTDPNADQTSANTCNRPLTTGTQTISGAKTFSSAIVGNLTGNASGTAGGLSGTPNIAVGTITGPGISTTSTPGNLILGDYDEEVNSTFLGIDDPGKVISTSHDGASSGMYLDWDNWVFKMGDWDGENNECWLLVDDDSENIVLTTSGTTALTINSSQNATFGGTVTGTTFIGALTGNVTGNTSGTAGGLSGSPNITTGTITCTTIDSGNGATEIYDMNQDLRNDDKVQHLSLGIGTIAPTTTGEIRATNEVTAYYGSDIAMKKNITPISNPLDKVLSIGGYNFDWKSSVIKDRGGEDGYFVRKNDVGIIAQEVEKVCPEIVATRKDGHKAVKYDKLVPLLIESIKELTAKVMRLEDGNRE